MYIPTDVVFFQVLKVAILAEKYAVDYSWYVDTILNLIRIAGDYVSEEVWYRVIQIVINRDDVQGYAAKTVFEVLHENVKEGHTLIETDRMVIKPQYFLVLTKMVVVYIRRYVF